jgi:hypothetical protein
MDKLLYLNTNYLKKIHIMPSQKPLWKKGRGKLGVLNPLLGSWVAEAESPPYSIIPTN